MINNSKLGVFMESFYAKLLSLDKIGAHSEFKNKIKTDFLFYYLNLMYLVILKVLYFVFGLRLLQTSIIWINLKHPIGGVIKVSLKFPSRKHCWWIKNGKIMIKANSSTSHQLCLFCNFSKIVHAKKSFKP